MRGIITRSSLRLRSILVAFALGLALTTASAVAGVLTGGPVAGGHYKGANVTLAVTGSKANFASGRFAFTLQGQGGLGSCAGPGAYITLHPTRARQISKTGVFHLTGHFTLAQETPQGPVKYAVSAKIDGSFTSNGRSVSATIQEVAVGRGLTCRSGVVHYSADLVVH